MLPFIHQVNQTGRRWTRAIHPGRDRLGYLVFSLQYLIALGLAVRLWGLNAGLWYDEAYSVILAQLPLDRMIQATLGDVHPPLYYIILAGVGHVINFSGLALRLPSLLAGLLLIYLVHRLACRLFDNERLAVIATAITVLSPFQVYYSQEIRFYSLQMAAVTVTVLGLIERRRWWLIGGALASLYIHNMSVFWIIAIFLVGWLIERRLLVFEGVVIGLGYLPGAAMAIYQALNLWGGFWIPYPSLGRPLGSMDDLIFFSPQNSFVIATAALTSLALIWIATSKWDRPAYFCLILAGLPIMLITLVSFVWKPILISRTLAPSAIFFYILIARSIERSQWRLMVWGGAAALVSVFILFIGPLIGDMGRPVKDEDFFNFWGEFQEGDSIFHANLGSYIVWSYYYPERNQYTWAQQTTLEQSLTWETRRAMGIQERDFEFQQCLPHAGRPFSGRWFLIYFNNPTTLPAEMEYIDHLIHDYDSRLVKQIISNEAAEAAVYLIDPHCQKTTR